MVKSSQYLYNHACFHNINQERTLNIPNIFLMQNDFKSQRLSHVRLIIQLIVMLLPLETF